MKLLGAIPVIHCRQIELTLQFYQRALQFVILNQRSDKHGLAWVHLQSGDVALMLERSDDTTGNAVRLYFYVDAIQQLHHYLKANRQQPGSIRTTAYHTQEFDLTDPEGNSLTLGQKMTAS